MQSLVLTATTSCTLTLANLPDRLHIYTRGTAAGKILATDISLAVTVTSGHLDGADVAVAQADSSLFTDGPAIGGLQQICYGGCFSASCNLGVYYYWRKGCCVPDVADD